MFNIFLCNLFFIINDVDFASYPHGNTPYIAENDFEDVAFKLQNVSKILIQWFVENQMKANLEKYHFISSTNVAVNLFVENQMIENRRGEKTLGIKFNYELTFNGLIDDTRKKTELKLNALSRKTLYMNFTVL